jgi:hypothetical protein
MNAVIEFTAPPEAKQALDQKGESDERPSWSLSGRSVAGTVVAVLLVFYTLFLAASLLVPIAAAVLVSMLLAPAVQLLQRLRVPRLLASAVVVLSVVGLLGVGITALAAPAKIWIDRTAQSLQKLEQKFRATTRPIDDIKKATGQLQDATQVTAGPASSRGSCGRTGVGRPLVVCYAPRSRFNSLHDHIGVFPARVRRRLPAQTCQRDPHNSETRSVPST